jgi:hypothetical protein
LGCRQLAGVRRRKSSVDKPKSRITTEGQVQPGWVYANIAAFDLSEPTKLDDEHLCIFDETVGEKQLAFTWAAHLILNGNFSSYDHETSWRVLRRSERRWRKIVIKSFADILKPQEREYWTQGPSPSRSQVRSDPTKSQSDSMMEKPLWSQDW